MRLQQRKMQGLLTSDLHPIAVIGIGESVKAPGGIERQIDRVKFDMRDGVHQRCVAGHAVG